MSTLSLRIRYRPIRLGWCIQLGNWDQLRMALRLTHAFAGGKFNPLIPVDAPVLAENLVDAFKVDLLVPIANIDPIPAFVTAHDYLSWPEHDQRLFWPRDLHTGRPPYAAFVDVYHAIRRIYETEIKGVPDPTVQASVVACEDADPLRDVLLATVGAYPEPSDAVPNYQGLVIRNLHGEEVLIHANDAWPARLESMLTPSQLTTHGLEIYGTAGDPGFYVGHADRFEDVLNYWNLRAAGIQLSFVDPRHAERLRPVLDQQRLWLESRTPRPWRDPADIAVWARDYDGNGRVDGFDATTLAPRIVRHGVSEDAWNGLNVKALAPHWPEQAVLGSVDESGPTPSVTFALPTKPTYDEPTLHAQDVVVSISGFDHFPQEKNVTFFPPYLPELNEFYSQELHHIRSVRSEFGQMSDAGLGVITRIGTDDLTLRALSAADLAAQIFRRFRIKATVSQAGRIASRLIAQMGGPQGCRVFKIEGVRNLVEAYRADKHFAQGNALRVIGSANWRSFEDLYIATRPMTRKLEPQDALDLLLLRRVFRVGIELNCPHCELSFWQSVDDLATEVECQLCGKEFDIAVQLRDRRWAYRRSGLFGRDDHQQGSIPVAVTLQQLHTNAHSFAGLSGAGLLYTTSLLLDPAGAAIDPCETDFAAIVSGGTVQDRREIPSILIGECKAAGGEITEDDARHLARVADALPTRRVKTFIVFAKTGAFTPADVRAAALAQHDWIARVILLSKDELEPYGLFERHPGIDGRFRMGLDGLAEFTIHQHPALKPPHRP